MISLVILLMLFLWAPSWSGYKRLKRMEMALVVSLMLCFTMPQAIQVQRNYKPLLNCPYCVSAASYAAPFSRGSHGANGEWRPQCKKCRKTIVVKFTNGEITQVSK